MDKTTATPAVLAISIFMLGSLQAWDSEVPSAGLLTVTLVSLAIALPPVALLLPLKQSYFLGTFLLSLTLLVLARVSSPISLPGLFLVLVPAAMGLIFTGVFAKEAEQSS